VFGTECDVPACQPKRAIFGVLTPLTVRTLATYAPISRGTRSWGSPFEAFPSHLVPTRFRGRNEVRSTGQPCGSPTVLARLLLPPVQADEINRGSSRFTQFPGFSSSENPTIPCGYYAASNPLLPWGFSLQGFLPPRHESAFTNLPLPDLHDWLFAPPRPAVPQRVSLRGGQLSPGFNRNCFQP